MLLLVAEYLPSFERVVTNTPYNSFAIAYQCAALFQLDKYEDAIGKCDGALQVNGNWGNISPSFALVYKGLALRKLGRLESALLLELEAIILRATEPP
jgi:tetratricopeptide (TPR) repeat protein